MNLFKQVLAGITFLTMELFQSRSKLKSAVLGMIFVIVLSAVCTIREQLAVQWRVPRGLRRFLAFPAGYRLAERSRARPELRRLAARLQRANVDAEVRNWDAWGPLEPAAPVLLVQVHRDVERLQYLIISLGLVRRIHSVLLIFSHSFYDEDINRLVRDIKFTKVMQIFYPYSLQLHPGGYPGDCGGPRDARLAEHKQHWWWKANYVFRGLDRPAGLRGMVLFLDEADYVLPDLLHMLNYGQNSLPAFPSVGVLSFGAPYDDRAEYDTFVVDIWRPLFDRGLAFNGTTWSKIEAQAQHFCFFDDHSWSSSLMHLSEKLPSGLMDMAATAAPRVWSLAARGGGGRSADAAWRAMEAASRRARLFPRRVLGALRLPARGRARSRWRPAPRGNGGWADPRDQLLCLDPLLADYPFADSSTLRLDDVYAESINDSIMTVRD